MYICKATGSWAQSVPAPVPSCGVGQQKPGLLPSQSDVIRETYCLQITLESTQSCYILKCGQNNTAVAKHKPNSYSVQQNAVLPCYCLICEIELMVVKSACQFRLLWLLSPLIRFSCCSAKACHFCLFFLQPSSKGEQASDTCVRA